MSVYLLRVGADTTKWGGQTRSPMLEDYEYYFLPIPVFSTREEGAGLSYASYEWHGRRVLEYLPPERKETLVSMFVHLDPEFIGYTYGSPPRNRKGLREKNYAKLCALKAGDLLVFYAYFLIEIKNIAYGINFKTNWSLGLEWGDIPALVIEDQTWKLGVWPDIDLDLAEGTATLTSIARYAFDTGANIWTLESAFGNPYEPAGIAGYPLVMLLLASLGVISIITVHQRKWQ